MEDVRKLYLELLAQGKSEQDAAKEAQARTGHSVVTGQPIRQKGLKFTSKGVTYGQQDTLKRKGDFLRQY